MSENESNSECPSVQRQMVFAESGEIEPEEGPVSTSLSGGFCLSAFGWSTRRCCLIFVVRTASRSRLLDSY